MKSFNRSNQITIRKTRHIQLQQGCSEGVVVSVGVDKAQRLIALLDEAIAICAFITTGGCANEDEGQHRDHEVYPLPDKPKK